MSATVRPQTLSGLSHSAQILAFGIDDRTFNASTSATTRTVERAATQLDAISKRFNTMDHCISTRSPLLAETIIFVPYRHRLM
jgi:hypothetical protein